MLTYYLKLKLWISLQIVTEALNCPFTFNDQWQFVELKSVSSCPLGTVIAPWDPTECICQLTCRQCSYIDNNPANKVRCDECYYSNHIISGVGCVRDCQDNQYIGQYDDPDDLDNNLWPECLDVCPETEYYSYDLDINYNWKWYCSKKCYRTDIQIELYCLPTQNEQGVIIDWEPIFDDIQDYLPLSQFTDPSDFLFYSQLVQSYVNQSMSKMNEKCSSDCSACTSTGCLESWAKGTPSNVIWVDPKIDPNTLSPIKDDTTAVSNTTNSTNNNNQTSNTSTTNTNGTTDTTNSTGTSGSTDTTNSTKTDDTNVSTNTTGTNSNTSSTSSNGNTTSSTNSTKNNETLNTTNSANTNGTTDTANTTNSTNTNSTNTTDTKTTPTYPISYSFEAYFQGYGVFDYMSSQRDILVTTIFFTNGTTRPKRSCIIYLDQQLITAKELNQGEDSIWSFKVDPTLISYDVSLKTQCKATISLDSQDYKSESASQIRTIPKPQGQARYIQVASEILQLQILGFNPIIADRSLYPNSKNQYRQIFENQTTQTFPPYKMSVVCRNQVLEYVQLWAYTNYGVNLAINTLIKIDSQYNIRKCTLKIQTIWETHEITQEVEFDSERLILQKVYALNQTNSSQEVQQILNATQFFFEKQFESINSTQKCVNGVMQANVCRCNPGFTGKNCQQSQKTLYNVTDGTLTTFKQQNSTLKQFNDKNISKTMIKIFKAMSLFQNLMDLNLVEKYNANIQIYFLGQSQIQDTQNFEDILVINENMNNNVNATSQQVLEKQNEMIFEVLENQMESNDTDCIYLKTNKMEILIQRISVDTHLPKNSLCPMSIQNATFRVEPAIVKNKFFPKKYTARLIKISASRMIGQVLFPSYYFIGLYSNEGTQEPTQLLLTINVKKNINICKFTFNPNIERWRSGFIYPDQKTCLLQNVKSPLFLAIK